MTHRPATIDIKWFNVKCRREYWSGILTGKNPLASEKRARADEKGAFRQEGGKIKPHRNRRACPDAVGVDKNHAEKLLPPLWRSRLLYGLSGANATGRGRQTDFFAIRRKRSHLAPAFPPAASRRDGGNGGRSKFLRARGPSQAHPGRLKPIPKNDESTLVAPFPPSSGTTPQKRGSAASFAAARNRATTVAIGFPSAG